MLLRHGRQYVQHYVFNVARLLVPSLSTRIVMASSSSFLRPIRASTPLVSVLTLLSVLALLSLRAVASGAAKEDTPEAPDLGILAPGLVRSDNTNACTAEEEGGIAACAATLTAADEVPEAIVEKPLEKGKNSPTDTLPAFSTFVDLSVPIEEGAHSDPEICLPKVTYVSHKAGFAQLRGFFPGLRKEDLPGGDGWAIEKVEMCTHSGTHVDAPWRGVYHTHTHARRSLRLDDSASK